MASSDDIRVVLSIQLVRSANTLQSRIPRDVASPGRHIGSNLSRTLSPFIEWILKSERVMEYADAVRTIPVIDRNGSHDPQARTGGTGDSPSNRHQFGNRLKAELSRPAFGCRKAQGAITFETKTLREAEGRLNTAWVCQALASLPIALCSLLEHEHRLDGEAKGGHGHNVVE
ncbi:hypothetical protein BS47DRAFT_1395408 [Hydnum rufescens UP504]|uniref:Uncharacterized protein n=1 Tax=Hydnum rufescens UP504 TaxID=1448309 RepID=A0A9P6ASY1_9AGAM|nr:hypothetical protein BS47DRAFT_1395408 [Hydnum rufescens UP504]